MTLTSALPAGCVVIDFGSFGDAMLALGIVAIPAVAVPVLAYIARRYPSQGFLTQGRRPGGIRMYRWGLAVFGTSLAGAIVSITLTWLESATCQPESIGWLVVSVIGAVIGSLLIGGGWAMAIRATWVVLATIAVLDVWIFYINLLFGIADPSAVLGLVLVAAFLALGLYGWRMMKRANIEKAAMLSGLAGETVTLRMSHLKFILPTRCVVVRVDGDQVVVRDHNLELVYPLAAIVEIDRAGQRLGRW